MTAKKRPPADPPSKVVLRELRRTRERKRWTQDDLARRVTELGVKMDRGTVAKVETGRRGISVDDVFLFAAALDVSPAALLLPHERGATVAVAPDLEVPASLARAWMQWRLPLEDDPDAARFYREQVPDEMEAANSFLPNVAEIRRLAGLVEDAAYGAAEHPKEAGTALASVLDELATESKHAGGTLVRRMKD